MFAKETYIARRAKLKQTIGSGLLLFLGNDESGMNYADNTYHFRQDSTFLYFFGLPYAGLSAIIDIDNNREIIFGDELTIDAIVWMGTQRQMCIRDRNTADAEGKERSSRYHRSTSVQGNRNLSEECAAERPADSLPADLPRRTPDQAVPVVRRRSGSRKTFRTFYCQPA